MKTIRRPTETFCVICGDTKRPFTNAEYQADEVKLTKSGPAHADCYYAELGKLIDQRPIISPRVRRG